MMAVPKQGDTSPAEILFLHGFTEEVISVVPPKATLTPNSKLDAKDLGKVPGRKMSNGQWCGGWVRAEDIQEAQRFHRWGGNLGLETTRLIPIDIDVNDVSLHKPLTALAQRLFGKNVPVRTGRRPLIILRMKGKFSFGKMVAMFARKDDPEKQTHKIETFNGPLKHFVISGTHPSGIEYQCTPPVERLRFEDIPEATERDVLNYFEEAQALLQDKHGCRFLSSSQDARTARGGEQPPSAEELAGTLKQLEAALRQIPNTKGRDRWVDVCHALKGATQNMPEKGKALWLKWCEQREDGDPHTKEAKRVWDSAGRHGGLWIGMDALLTMADMREVIAQNEFAGAPEVDESTLPGTEPRGMFVIQPVHARPLTRPDWVVRNMIPSSPCVGVMYGPPGGNKSTMATAMAVHIALGLPFADNIVKPGSVLMISEEDAPVNRRRLTAWELWLHQHAKELNLSEGWRDQLRNSILEPYPSFGHINRKKIKAIKDAAVRLQETHGRIRVVFVDTLARTFIEGGEENEAADMGKYIDLAEELAGVLSCAVVLLHHPPKNADTLRGHGSLLGAAGLVMKVERTPNDGIVRLYCQKMREAAEFEPVAFNRRSMDISLMVARKDEDDDEVETALVLEHTEWTEVAGDARKKGAATTSTPTGGTAPRIHDMEILRQMALYPDVSGRRLAAVLGFASNSALRYRLEKLEALGMVQKDDNARWTITDNGLKTFEQQHPDGVLA